MKKSRTKHNPAFKTNAAGFAFPAVDQLPGLIVRSESCRRVRGALSSHPARFRDFASEAAPNPGSALPILAKMQSMLKELLDDPESRLLGVQSLGMGGSVQYWKSVEHLLAYAERRDKQHRPMAECFYEKLFKSQAVGIWHESYSVPDGHHESLYANMPRFGLGKVMDLEPAVGERGTARKRLALSRTKVARTRTVPRSPIAPERPQRTEATCAWVC